MKVDARGTADRCGLFGWPFAGSAVPLDDDECPTDLTCPTDCDRLVCKYHTCAPRCLPDRRKSKPSQAISCLHAVNGRPFRSPQVIARQYEAAFTRVVDAASGRFLDFVSTV
jgi:hypothetical protein